MEFDYKLQTKTNYIEILYRPNLYIINFGYEIKDRAIEIVGFKDSVERCIDFIEKKYDEAEYVVLNRESFYLTLSGNIPKKQRKLLEEIVCLNNKRFV